MQMSESKENLEESQKKPSFFISVRFLTSVLVFFGYCFQYMLKINMSIAIVCMVNNTAIYPGTKVIRTNTECPAAASSSSKSSFDGPFAWDKGTQGIILASYFYGYITTQIFGGWLSLRFGGRRVLGISMFISAIVTIITPPLTKLNYIALIVTRILVGVCHGVFWPAVSSIWSAWAPPNERSRLVGMASAGSWFGNIIALPFGGYLCVNGFDSGWPSIFYIFGAMGAVWCIIFLLLTSDSPSTHRLIRPHERDYIIRETRRKNTANMPTPWKALFFSKPCIAIYVIHFASNWGIYLFLTQLPTFLSDVLYFDIKSNSLISALPYIASVVVTFVTSLISDKLIQSGKISIKNVRKLFGVVGTLIPIGAMIGLVFVTCKFTVLAIVLLVIGISFTACLWAAAHLVNINDIGGPYSGILFGISNTFATITGIVSPYIVGLITTHKTQKEWQIVFIICAAFYFVGGLLYLILCEADLQPWAAVKSEETDESKDQTETESVHRF